MKRTQLALLAAGVALVAGGGTALAGKGDGGGHARHAFAPLHARDVPFQTALTYLGITKSALRQQLESGKTLAQVADATPGKSAAGLVAAMVAAYKQALADAVAAGRLTQADADRIASTLTEQVTAFVNHQGGLPPLLNGLHFDGGLDAAASYLGVTTNQLLMQLRAGKTLAQIANATPGKSVSGLVDALVADARTRITKIVNGTLPLTLPFMLPPRRP